MYAIMDDKWGGFSVHPFGSELLLSFSLFVVIILLVLSLLRFNRIKRDTTIITISLVLFILIESYVVIHLFFCYQWGFPASVTQDNGRDLSLSSSDWLSFLSGYLSFAGSLVMAYLVYRQSKIIDKLTISEYLPSASIIIHESVKSIDYHNFCADNIIQCPPNNPEKKYYTFHCDLVDSAGILCENYEILLFTEIINNSKSTICKLSLLSIELEDVQDKRKKIIFKNRSGSWDPTDRVTDLLPESKIGRCFLIDKMPKSFGISWMTINFLYGDNISLKTRVLVSKSSDSGLIFINGTSNSR